MKFDARSYDLFFVEQDGYGSVSWQTRTQFQLPEKEFVRESNGFFNRNGMLSIFIVVSMLVLVCSLVVPNRFEHLCFFLVCDMYESSRNGTKHGRFKLEVDSRHHCPCCPFCS